MSIQTDVVKHIDIKVASGICHGDLCVPKNAMGLVIFAHGSGSSRKSRRNQSVARVLEQRNLATLLMDLLTYEEEQRDLVTAELRFDIPFLAARLLDVTAFVRAQNPTLFNRMGYFGSSTGAAAALVAACSKELQVDAIVSRGGRPDLAWAALPMVKAPTLLIVGGDDVDVLHLNQKAYEQLSCEKELRIVEGATHLFEEPGKLEKVAKMAADWFFEHFG